MPDKITMPEKIDRFVRHKTANLLRLENRELFFEGYPETRATVKDAEENENLDNLRVFLGLCLEKIRTSWEKFIKVYSDNNACGITSIWGVTLNIQQVIKALGLSDCDRQNTAGAIMDALCGGICGKYVRIDDRFECPLISLPNVDVDSSIVQFSSPYLAKIFEKMIEEADCHE